MHMNVDFPQVQVVGVSTEDTDGTAISEDAFVIPVLVPLSEVGGYLDPAFYDPASSTSPSAANSRAIARVVLDALKRAAEEP
jgi:hypothetical protein